MMTNKRSRDTIAAMLSSAPALVREDEPEVTPTLQPGEEVYEATAELVRPTHMAPVPEPVDDGDFEDDDLEAFEFEASAPIVKPRRREVKDYQTVRINRPTARILRAQWLLARQVDPLVTFTEFSTVVAQHGLRALKEQRERGE